MRLRLLSGMCLVALLSSGIAASGCGSSDDKKKNAPRDGGGGDGGAGIAEVGSGGAGGTAGSSGSLGDAGSKTAGDAGSSPSGGGDAGAGGVQSMGGASGGGAGGEGPVVPFHGLYVGKGGDDAAAGTIDAPFETLAHAATVAQAGDTIVFLDGSYAVGTTAAIPTGVNLMANTSGAVTLTGTGSGTPLLLNGDTRIEGLKFQSFARVAYFRGGAAATGTLTLVDSTFSNCTIGLELTGSTSVVASADESFVVGNGGNAFAVLSEEANLSMTGGILQNYAGGVILAGEESTVSLTDVQVLDGTGSALSLIGDAIANLSGVTFATLASSLIVQRDNSKLTIADSDLSIKPAAATTYYCVSNVVNGTGSLTITDSVLHDCGTAIRGGIYETMTITNVQFSNLTFGGMDLGAGASGLGGIIRITGSTFGNLGVLALRIGSSSNLNDFKIRNSSFNCSSPANWNCLYFDGSNASTLDLGTLSDPGGNTFLQGSANETALRIGFQAINTTAVGNTWTPNVQSADPQGKYNAPQGSGQKLLISTPVATGRNYQMPYGGTLLLAENP